MSIQKVHHLSLSLEDKHLGGRKITTKLDIFVSYSHEDVDGVKPIVRLLRTVDTGVFIDRDDIHLGKRWRQEILNAIDASQAIWLFWCQHAADSKEIRLEYETGHQKDKDIPQFFWIQLRYQDHSM